MLIYYTLTTGNFFDTMNQILFYPRDKLLPVILGLFAGDFNRIELWAVGCQTVQNESVTQQSLVEYLFINTVMNGSVHQNDDLWSAVDSGPDCQWIDELVDTKTSYGCRLDGVDERGGGFVALPECLPDYVGRSSRRSAACQWNILRAARWERSRCSPHQRSTEVLVNGICFGDNHRFSSQDFLLLKGLFSPFAIQQQPATFEANAPLPQAPNLSSSACW